MVTESDITVCMATRDDRGLWSTVHSLRLGYPDLRFVIVDNSSLPNYKKFGQHHFGSLANVKYVSAEGEPSSCLYKELAISHAETKYVIVCDSHVLFDRGAIEGLIKYYSEHPKTADLIMGPLLSCKGGFVGTQQALYQWEQASLKPSATIINGVVCRNNQIGDWVIDERGTDPSGEPYEIQQQGTGAFSFRREAWVHFNPDFNGFGGNETYIMEKYRKRGDRVVCLPSFRWLHEFDQPEKKTYTVWVKDQLRNYKTGFQELGLTNLESVADKLFNPDQVAGESSQKFLSFIEKLGTNSGMAIPQNLFLFLDQQKLDDKVTLEFGSGISTLLLDSKSKDHTTIEHHEPSYNKIRKLVSNTDVVYAELIGDPAWYDWQRPKNKLYDLILIDGPPGWSEEQPGRLGAIAVADLLNENGMIIIDDAHRAKEQQLSKQLAEKLGLEVHVKSYGKRSWHLLVPPAEPLGEGVGTELHRMFHDAGFPACQQCRNLAVKMNANGVEWCEENVAEIVDDILPRAKTWVSQNKPWATKFLQVTKAEDAALRASIRLIVNRAISQYRKTHSVISPE